MFNTLGVTVNTAYNGGEIEQHVGEAIWVMKLADVTEEIPAPTLVNEQWHKHPHNERIIAI